MELVVHHVVPGTAVKLLDAVVGLVRRDVHGEGSTGADDRDVMRHVVLVDDNQTVILGDRERLRLQRHAQADLLEGRDQADRAGAGCIVAILAAASASLAIQHWLVFRVATAVVIGFGFSAANQLYGLAGHLMPRREAGNAMGIVSLGAGLFGYFGPQMVGILRDATGSFSAGFYMVAVADLMTLGLIVLLYRMTRRST